MEGLHGKEVRSPSWEVCKQSLEALCRGSFRGGVGVGLVTSMSQGPLPGLRLFNSLSTWLLGTCAQPLKAFVMRVSPQTGWERPAHRNPSCLEMKDHCRLSPKK